VRKNNSIDDANHQLAEGYKYTSTHIDTQFATKEEDVQRNVPAVVEYDMGESSSKSCKSNPIGECKESAEVQATIRLVCSLIELELAINHLINIVLLPICLEKFAREHRKCLGVIQIVPVGNGGDHVHD